MTTLDPALASLLSFPEESTATVSSIGGGSSSAQTSKLTITLPDGTVKVYFIKTASGPSGKQTFESEHFSLSSIHSVCPTLCPQSYGYGEMQHRPKTWFLVTDFLDRSSSRYSESTKGQSLARKLAKLHTNPAPIPEGYEVPQFGFPLPTNCGETVQDNAFSSSWADFYANSRLRSIRDESVRNNGSDEEVSRLVEKICTIVVPRLLGNDQIKITPVLVHGDLWSGNHTTASLPGMSSPEPVIYDPSACYAHSEFELGIMKMFGGFGRDFWEEYHTLVPKGEPVGEYEDRIRLYELYHQLNHYAMFGGGYRGSAVRIMNGLIGKYGDG